MQTPNRRKDEKIVYFVILGYYTVMHAKYSRNICRKKAQEKRTGNTDDDGNMSDEEEDGPRNYLATGGQPSLSQEDSYIIIKMKQYRDILLKAFDDKVVVPCNATNHWSISTI